MLATQKFYQFIDSIFRNRIFIDEKLLKRLSKRAVTLLCSLESLPEAQRYCLDFIDLLFSGWIRFICCWQS